ncbi:MAG: hypothetical protein UU93_C0005G0010 [Candidatus Amesbacteria bacterium GW2011_GWA2_42_12]|uniref:Carbohydrate kinase PfkB domain-containing protein n=1 Tax=Candidatus Amesbacteria bacterium GW2011_GWA2_42_12 TaxID=1618356 RepID=A0A0G0Y7I5_9BACT|nr:MAG: hypothetical protein UU93_C0005G0010 [Candidatus Amesbacteria bacterium GW2011_GWA2_42_12]
MRYNILSLGPARMDVFLKLPEVEVDEVCSIDRKRCVIELGFGDKIALRGVDFAIGGNSGNNAVGLSRLGLSAAMVGAMGDGWMDQKALEILKGEKVETKYVQINKGQNGFGAVLNYQEERTILSYYADALCCFPEDTELKADWIYLTSMGKGFEDFYLQSVEWAIKNNAKIGFNPGTRQIAAGLEKIKHIFVATEVLFVNREEATALLTQGSMLNAKYSITDIKGLLNGLRSLGPKVVVITDGPGGTYSYDGEKYLYMPIVDAPVVERTGAGDAFGSGFLGAYIQNKPVDECLKWGTVNSASVLGFIGPQAGLLTLTGMTEWLKKAETVQAKEI